MTQPGQSLNRRALLPSWTAPEMSAFGRTSDRMEWIMKTNSSRRTDWKSLAIAVMLITGFCVLPSAVQNQTGEKESQPDLF